MIVRIMEYMNDLPESCVACPLFTCTGARYITTMADGSKFTTVAPRPEFADKRWEGCPLKQVDAYDFQKSILE